MTNIWRAAVTSLLHGQQPKPARWSWWPLFASSLTACGFLLGAAPLAKASPDSETIRISIQLYGQLDDMCRGWPGTDPHIGDVCDAREKVSNILQSEGYCYSYPEPGWHECENTTEPKLGEFEHSWTVAITSYMNMGTVYSKKQSDGTMGFFAKYADCERFRKNILTKTPTMYDQRRRFYQILECAPSGNPPAD